MQGKFVSYEVHEKSIGIVTLNSPPVNALNSDAYFELYQAMYELAVSNEIKVVILVGAGEKAFVAGADVREFLTFDDVNGMVYTRKNAGVREYIRKFPKPVICAINGLAYGGGCALAMVCDIRICSEHAKFNLSEVNMGIVGAIPYAAAVMTSGTARKLVYSGEAIDAQQALNCGLVEEIVAKDALMPRCIELAKKIAAKPPLALRAAKACMVAASEQSLPKAIAFEGEAISRLWGTSDKNEAVNAFLEKRTPEFCGV